MTRNNNHWGGLAGTSVKLPEEETSNGDERLRKEADCCRSSQSVACRTDLTQLPSLPKAESRHAILVQGHNRVL